MFSIKTFYGIRVQLYPLNVIIQEFNLKIEMSPVDLNCRYRASQKRLAETFVKIACVVKITMLYLYQDGQFWNGTLWADYQTSTFPHQNLTR